MTKAKIIASNDELNDWFLPFDISFGDIVEVNEDHENKGFYFIDQFYNIPAKFLEIVKQ